MRALIVIFAIALLPVISCAQQVIYAKTDPHDSTVLANFNKELQKYGWPSLWDETKHVVQWGPIVFEGPEPYHVTGLSIYGSNMGVPSFTAAILPPCIAMLKDIPTLHSLSIDVDLQSLPPEIGQLNNITSLGLAHNLLTDLPPELTALQNLKELLLTNNKFSEVPDLAQLHRLEHLSLSSNALLAELPEALFTWTNLKTLDIGWTSITALPESISKLSNLEHLNVSVCKLKKLPESIGSLSKLKVLQVDYNELTSLPASIGQLTVLEQLNVAGNQLTTFPSTISQLSKLRSLDFSANKFTAFPNLAISSLLQINGERNQMQGTIPASFFNQSYPEKIRIYLSDNQLSGKLMISKPSVVHTLYIRNNRFVFSDVYDVYASLKHSGAYMEFNPQDRIGTTRSFFPSKGENLSFSIDNYTHLEGSVYTWYHSPTIHGGSQSVVSSNQTLTLSNFDPAVNNGVYYCKVTHPSLGNWQLQSHPVRVIGENKAPTISGSDIIQRRGSPMIALVTALDDFTPAENLIWSIPASTKHLVITDQSASSHQKQLSIASKDSQWLGADTIMVSVADEHGNTSTKAIIVTVIGEINQAPTLKTLPPIYLKEESWECAPENLEDCESVWIFYSGTFMDNFIMDDLDRPDQLTLSLHPDDQARFSTSDFMVTLFETAGGWALEILLVSEQDTAFTDALTVLITDTEGGTTAAQVQFIIPQINNEPPMLIDVPKQQIIKGEMTFPGLSLSYYIQDDNATGDYVHWIPWAYPGLDVKREDDKAIVSPKLETAYTDTVIFVLQEKTNYYMERSVKVAYHILEEGMHVYGTILTSEDEPVEGVSLEGFPMNVITNASGFYETEVVPGWSGTITPELNSFTFTPGSLTFTNIQADVESNFTATHIGVYEISGYVRDVMNNPQPDIVLQGFPVNVMTDESGKYTATVPAGWSGDIIPSGDKMTFSPGSRSYRNVNSHHLNESYASSVISALTESHNQQYLRLWPNPSKGAVHIEMTASFHSELVIHDVYGREIVRYHIANTPQEVIWNARDQHGEKAADGIYYITLFFKRKPYAVCKDCGHPLTNQRSTPTDFLLHMAIQPVHVQDSRA